MNMTYEFYILQPMQAIELKVNMIFAINPHLLKSLDRTANDRLIRNYSHTLI